MSNSIFLKYHKILKKIYTNINGKRCTIKNNKNSKFIISFKNENIINANVNSNNTIVI